MREEKALTKWGVFDTKDNLWMGDDTGPRLFDAEILARIAAQMVDVQLGQAPGRSRAKAYPEGPVHKVDEKDTQMTPLQALRHLERGTKL